MVFFSWKKVLRVSGGSSNRILLILKALSTDYLPRNRWDPLYKYKNTDFSGSSFLINPYTLVTDAHYYKPKDIAVYMGLASFRSYSEYSMTRDASLNLFHSPICEEKLKQNRLLSIKNGRVHFRYEEVTRRK